MQTRIHPDLVDLPKVQEAESNLRSCVHCGFCTATCPSGVKYSRLLEIGKPARINIQASLL